MERLFFFYSFLCFVLLISRTFCSSFEHHLCSPTECSALLQFKQSFEVISGYSDCFPSFPKTKSWKESRDCCSWDGVTCDLLNGHVIGLDLSCSQIVGTFHPNSTLFQLHHLQTLNLAYNYFDTSSIPRNIGGLRNLRHLNLSDAWFQGKIPTEISYLSNLVSLDLSNSYALELDERTFETMLQNFTNLELLALPLGSISSPIHPNSSLFQLHHLHTLNLYNDYFHPSSIPNGIGRLTNLRHLIFSGFDGKIPTEISYLSNLVSLDLSNSYHSLQLDERTFETMLHNFTNLELLSISEVNISSPIPLNISSSLRYLDLDYTNLRGVLTESFFLVPNSLETVKLSGNDLLKGVFPKIHRSNTLLMELDISYTGISGELPHSIGTFSSLNILDLGGCQFSGTIPDSIGNLTQITELVLSNNHFTDHIPSTISKFKHLTLFDLSSNSFSGEIPDVFSNLQQLRYLYLNDNSFIGSFPSTVLNLTHLATLNLWNNSLSGPLPSNASMLQKLTELELSYNSLNGTIPSWVFSLPLVYSVSLKHNRFRGIANEVIKTNPTLLDLYLSNNQLSGFFPLSLANLTNLNILDLSSNNITGDAVPNITFPSLGILFLSSCELKDFPLFLRNVNTLTVLDISNNKIRGQIPNWFSGKRWESLLHLNLSHNSLTGHLPQFHNYHSLGYLDLKFNSLKGPLPSSICNMNKLEFLDLSHNNFSNSIPSCLRSMASLMVLDLRRNNFTGSIPPLCAHNTSLRTIVLNGNQFEGPISMSLLNCDGLEVLDLGNNAINDTFPAWLGTLEQLQVLILKSNVFHGPISTCQTKFCFPKLRIFDLSCNEFSGSLPAKVFGKFKAMIKLDGEDTGDIKYMKQFTNSAYSSYEDSVSLVIKGQNIELQRISTIMTTIDLSSNHFEGVIPETLKDLSSLWLLNLSHNNLTGHIPMELGQLNMLEALDLSWNRLTGKIPQELTTMNFLEFLNLSQNHLVGPIPIGPQFNTFENDSYGGNLDLCGPPLSKKCGTSDPSRALQPLGSEEDEDESYFFSGFTWESVVIGYSFGLVVGTVMWSLMFKHHKPKWFVEFFEGIFPKKMRRSQKRRLRLRI